MPILCLSFLKLGTCQSLWSSRVCWTPLCLSSLLLVWMLSPGKSCSSHSSLSSLAPVLGFCQSTFSSSLLVVDHRFWFFYPCCTVFYGIIWEDSKANLPSSHICFFLTILLVLENVIWRDLGAPRIKVPFFKDDIPVLPPGTNRKNHLTPGSWFEVPCVNNLLKSYSSFHIAFFSQSLL